MIAALGIPVRVALLKGRSSYLCLQRLESARQDVQQWTHAALKELADVEVWAGHTRTGDMAELSQLHEGAAILDHVTSTRDNCLGVLCSKAVQCHVNRARREAMVSDVVVINHHLFFADWDVRESSDGQFLPTVDSVVFDEAHRLNEIGVPFLGRQIGSAQMQALCKDLIVWGPQLAPAWADWDVLALQLDAAATALCVVCHGTAEHGRRAWTAEIPNGVEEDVWQTVVMAMHTALQKVDLVLRALPCIAPELVALAVRARFMAAELNYFSCPLQADEARWLDVSHHVTLIQSPLSIAQAMRTRVGPVGTELPRQDGRSWVFTSATLGHDAELSWFMESCGLDGAQCLQVPSPFDYGAQAALFVPADMPHPDGAAHSAAVAALAAQAAAVLGGRTLLLTTTLRAMRAIAQALRADCDAIGIKILVQGELPKRELAARFVQMHASGSGCILVASASFWEGIDIAGDALQLVMIDKLPFSPPDDPLARARASQVKAMGKNAFMHFYVPQAALALKQGAGRLIRTETDRGVLVVCDVRLTQRGYGRKVMAALPAMKRLETIDEFTAALAALTRPSTKDRCSA